MRSSTLVSPADLVKRELAEFGGHNAANDLPLRDFTKHLAKTALALAQARFWFRLSCGSSGRGGTVNMV